MKKILKWGLIGTIGLIVLIALLGSGEKTYEDSSDSSATATNRVTKSDLMAKNEPTIKKLNFATADYIGQSFTLYAMATASDYYNYGFTDEMKYYSLKVWDTSVSGEYEGTYAYIDKTNPELKAEELLNKLLEDDLFLKVEVSIPQEKYRESSNSFLEINSWEEVAN